MADKPSVLFVCVHNAGRSQMAAGYLNHFGGDRIEVRSAGSEPADKINPVAVQAMAEEGIDIAAEQPKILTTEAVKASDVVITMGCGDTCPYYPGKRYEDWVLDDPAGQDIEHVRPIRDEIRRRVEQLISELQPIGAPLVGARSLVDTADYEFQMIMAMSKKRLVVVPPVRPRGPRHPLACCRRRNHAATFTGRLGQVAGH